MDKCKTVQTAPTQTENQGSLASEKKRKEENKLSNVT
jgi:hypothetical protein